MKKTFVIIIISMTTFISIHAMKTTTQESQGLTGWLYWRSWILPKPQLLWYAIANNLLECNNKDHKELVNQALLECINDNDVASLSQLYDLLNTKYPEEKLLEDRTAKKAYSALRKEQGNKKKDFNKQLQSKQQLQLADANTTLRKVYQEVDNLINTLEIYKRDEGQEFGAFCKNYETSRASRQQIIKMNPYITNDIESNSDVDQEGNLLLAPITDEKIINKTMDSLSDSNDLSLDNLIKALYVIHPLINKARAICDKQ